MTNLANDERVVVQTYLVAAISISALLLSAAYYFGYWTKVKEQRNINLQLIAIVFSVPENVKQKVPKLQTFIASGGASVLSSK